MRLTNSAPLLIHGRALLRALARLLVPIIVAYTLVANVMVLSGNQAGTVWIILVSGLAYLVSLVALAVSRVRFSRLLQQHDYGLADQLGLGQKRDWYGANTIMKNEALLIFLWRQEHRKLESPTLRQAAWMYALALVSSVAFGSLMFGSFLVFLSIAFSFLPRT